MNLKTIAKLAGVSTVTVSNVMNGKYNKASRETIERVQKIIEETGYHPSATARSLIMKPSRIIAVVIPNLHEDESFSDSPYNVQILGYLERYIRSHAVDVVVLTIPQSVAQDTADRLIGLGVRGFWNFTNVELSSADPDVQFENIHFADSLLTLSYRIANR